MSVGGVYILEHFQLFPHYRVGAVVSIVVLQASKTWDKIVLYIVGQVIT